METVIASIVVAILGMIGTLGGSYLSNKKSTALVTYRLEQLEQKVSMHNNLIDRTYKLEKSVEVLNNEVHHIESDIHEN